MTSQAANWAAVVYGRTRAADSWWQAAPPGSGPAGWLAQSVYAAFGGGRGLEACPRFLIAQDSRHRIVGVACQARELGGQMYSDGQRELSCFVGWVADRSAGGESSDLAGPALEEFQQKYADWATPVYQEIMTPVWDLPHSPFRHPAVTVPAAPPWAEQDGEVEYDLSERVPRPDEGLWPVGTWPALWAAALVTTGSFTCVIGWPSGRSARRDGVTHLGVADAPERAEPLAPGRLVRALAPAGEPAVPAEPQRAVPADRLRVQAHWPSIVVREPPSPTCGPRCVIPPVPVCQVSCPPGCSQGRGAPGSLPGRRSPWA